MPRLGVNTIRWILLGLNGVALVGLVYLGFGLVTASGDQLRTALPDPNAFVVPPDVQQSFDSSQLNALIRTHKATPPAKIEPKPREEPELPISASGPLDEWEIASTTIDESGRRYLTLQQKVETSAVGGAGAIATGRPAARTARRGRTPPSRARTARTRTSTRRVVTQAAETRWVREGGSFKVEGTEYTAVKISLEPEELDYLDPAGRRFKLVREYEEIVGLEFDDRGRVAVLIGLDDEELGLDPNARPAAGAPQEQNDDNRGEIRSPGTRRPANANRTAQPATSRKVDPKEAEKRAEARRELEAKLRDSKLTEQQRADLQNSLRKQDR